MRIKENLVLRRIGSENIIIVPSKDSVDLTEVYTLNETSVRIWEHFKNEDFTFDKIVEFLQRHYEVDYQRAMEDVQECMAILRAGGIIVDD
jgi:hypothetical protein